MKLSEMTTNQAADAMIRLSYPISRICDDEDAVKLIDGLSNMPNTSIFIAVAKMLPDFSKYLLKKHRLDLYEILGVLSFKKAEEIGEMNIKDTIQLIKDSYDELLADFFTQSVKPGKDKDS